MSLLGELSLLPESSLRRQTGRRIARAIGIGAIAVLPALLGAAAVRADGLPRGFVHLRTLAPGILQDMRYAGAHNFIGRPVRGYDAPECVLTQPAAQALAAAQAAVAGGGLMLIVWDCYRPARAVADFVRWTLNGDERMKAEFYPRTAKSRLVALGYIATRSSHSRGSAVDVGLAPATLVAPPAWNGAMPLADCAAPSGTRFADGAVDLGTGFDCFDPRAHFSAPHINAEARANRERLRAVLVQHGFAPYEREWWHFRLRDEPFPDRDFDFAVPARPR